MDGAEGTGKVGSMLRPSLLTRGPKQRRTLAVIPLALALALVASGCDKLTGGGWIQSATLVVGQKASFSFIAHCKTSTTAGVPTANFYDGEFEFSDQSFNPLLRIHGDINPAPVFGELPGVSCAEFKKTDLDPIMASGFEGVYRTQPSVTPAMQGSFVVTVFDGGEPATIAGDTICISLDGAFTYANCGVVQGGNIQVE